MDVEAVEKTPALRAEGLSFRYARSEVWSDVAFWINPGQIAFLTGPNGSGKSTLLRCLAGWSMPSEGTVEVFGRPFDGSDRAVRREIAFVPDVPSFYDDLTAAEHIRFVLDANRVPDAAEEARRLLEDLGLAAHADRFPSSYSRGMRLKLALVLAFMRKPRLLLLDEPYGPLDRDASRRLSALLSAARADGAAVLVSCHHNVPDLNPDLLLHLEGERLSTVRDVRPGDLFDGFERG
ncbi:ABC transporter ATP-binding protein [Paraeggerthella sp. LCP19S3_G8]|uniref:ABC transporter ATP-binding protein n=1 Tax=Paraeggerthella sp. LCP19S3_G8 TaxID=3440248 RepID=UPI002A8C3CB5|nr:ABC transporter ATP-binding protein [Paraeggerthella sp.]